MRFVNKIRGKITNIFKSYEFVFKEIRKVSRSFVWTLIFSISISGLLPVLSLYVFKVITSELEININLNHSINFTYFAYLSAIYMLAILLKSVALSIREYMNNLAGLKLTYSIQSKLIDKIKKIDYKNFYYPHFQNKYKTVLQNCQNQPSVVVFSTVLTISSLIQFLNSCIIITKLNLNLMIFLIVCFIPSLFININIKNRYIRTVDKTAQSNRRVGYFFHVMTERDYIKEQRLFNLYPFFYAKRELNFKKNLKMWKQFRKQELLYKFFSSILPCVGIFLSIVFLILESLKKNNTVADFIFYSGIIVSLQEIFYSLTYNVYYSYESIAFIEKFLNFLDLENEIKSGNKIISNKIIHTLEFKNVSFAYPNSNSFVLKDINLKFETGEIISLAGKNGCGKTTLVNLILRIFDPTTGKILLDGIDIKDYDYENYLTSFSTIFQDYQKYAVKLYDYISFGNIKDPKNILKAKQAAISATTNIFIENLPKGFDSNLVTLFDKQGIELSGGQWQKLAVSRVFFSKASTLIFDEPTSALDSTSESKIYKNIVKFGKGKITIFISHRMYSSKLAKRIIYIENGRIVSDGTHEELMRQNIEYKKLFEEQANKYKSSNASL